jgi:hypothetical protein
MKINNFENILYKTCRSSLKHAFVAYKMFLGLVHSYIEYSLKMLLDLFHLYIKCSQNRGKFVTIIFKLSYEKWRKFCNGERV